MTRTRLSSLDWLVMTAGPVVIGAILGMSRGAATIATQAVALPLILLGVTAVMLPALYIGTSLAGAAPPAREVGSAVLRGFRACGAITLGLTPPVLFVLATSHSRSVAFVLGAAVVAAAVVAGLRVLFADLFAARAEVLLVRSVFTLWSIVSLAIGARMYAQYMAG